MRIFWPILTCVLVCFLLWYFVFRKPDPNPELLKLQRESRELQHDKDSLRSKIFEQNEKFDSMVGRLEERDSIINIQKQKLRVNRVKIDFKNAGNRELDSLIWILGYDTL